MKGFETILSEPSGSSGMKVSLAIALSVVFGCLKQIHPVKKVIHSIKEVFHHFLTEISSISLHTRKIVQNICLFVLSFVSLQARSVLS